MSVLRREIRKLLLAGASLVCLLGVLGGHCEGGTPPPSGAAVTLTPAILVVPPATAFSIDIVVNATDPVQAWELSVSWDPTLIVPAGVDPNPDFDDDGVFFQGPTINPQAGTLTGLVDLRHGVSGVTGNFKIATLNFWSSVLPGTATLQIDGGSLALSNGGDLPLVISTTASITVQP